MRRIIAGPREAEGAADFDDLAIDREDRAHHAEIDREEHADRDQRDFRGLENAEPQDEQRHPGDRRDRAQRLHGGIEQPARQRPNSRRRRRAPCRRATPRPKPDARRASASPRCGARVRRCARVRRWWRRSCVGGGTSRPLDRPSQTMSSQASAKPTGSNSPSAGRAKRDSARRRGVSRHGGSRSAVLSAGSSTVMAIAKRFSRGIARWRWWALALRRSSCPALSRASTSSMARLATEDVDGRVKRRP